MEDQAQKDVAVVDVVVVVGHVDSTLLAEEAEVVPSVDDAEAVAAVEAVHNTHTEQEAEQHTSFQDNHI